MLRVSGMEIMVQGSGFEFERFRGYILYARVEGALPPRVGTSAN